jgi:hypothetical protein
MAELSGFAFSGRIERAGDADPGSLSKEEKRSFS